MSLFFQTDRLSACARISALTAGTFLLVSSASVFPQNHQRVLHNPTSGDPVSTILLMRIVHAEDERRWDSGLRDLFSARNANVRGK